jgi:ribonuclease T2
VRGSKSAASARLVGALLAVAVLTGSVTAQPREDRGAPAGRFDFYVLALSWSATWCQTTGEQRGSQQCERGRNPGFVLHGLWPQYASGYPAFCEPQGRTPSRDAMDKAAEAYPEAGLARHQWRKHGSCSGLAPNAYFEASAQARRKVAVPPALAAPRQDADWEVLEIERAFAAANPGLRPDMMAVTCRSGRLEEVRICLSRDIRGFVPCQEVDRDSCRARTISVPAAR